MALEVSVTGLDKIIKRLEEVADSEKVEGAVGKAAALVEGAAKKKAPKDDGDLRRSITSKVENKGGSVEGIVYTPLEYAPYVEFGTGLFAEKGGRTDVPWTYVDDEGNGHRTSGQKPQPYLRPALYENQNKISKIIKEAMLND